MWLLNTQTAILRYFNRPEDVPGGYAILSHVWGKPEKEDTFQSVQAAARTCEDNAARALTQDISSAGPAPLTERDLLDVVMELRETVRMQAEMLSALSSRVDQLEPGSSPSTPVSSEEDRLEDARLIANKFYAEGTVYTDPLPTIPRDSDLISEKICNFLIQAAKDGYEWAWADTCCIDKTSSTELTEAINSMFQYYSLSDVCYAYLSDVPPDGLTATLHSSYHSKAVTQFIASKWHKRGWTLQELLAPHDVVFMSNEWTIMGNKYNLAEALQKATEIPNSVLCMQEDFATKSIAERMSWAAKRETTRVEDEAYCLLGIFGVNMPTIYGEGRNAFYRLQEEMVKSSADSTFLAWGLGRSTWYPWHDYITVKDPTLIQVATKYTESTSSRHAFAHSPRLFQSSGDIVMGHFMTDGQRKLIPTGTTTFTVTQFGLRATLPIIKMSESRCIALLGCSHASLKQCVCLVLQADISTIGNERGWLPVYHCLSSFEGDHCMLILPHFACERKLKWKLKDIHISVRPAYREGWVVPRMRIARLMASSPQRPYQVTPAAVGRWEREFSRQHRGQQLVLSDVHMPPLPWSGSPPVVLLFERHGGLLSLEQWVKLTLGKCPILGSTHQLSESGGDASNPHTPPPESHPFGNHYAIVHYGPERDSFWSPAALLCASSHSCEHDHLDFARHPNYPHSPVYTTEITNIGGLIFRLEVRQSPLHSTALALDFYPRDLNVQWSLWDELDEAPVME